MVPVTIAVEWIENAVCGDCQVFGRRHDIEENRLVAWNRAEQADHQGIESPRKKRVVPQRDQILVSDRPNFREVHDHAVDGGAGGGDDLACQRNLQRISMTVQVPALALVVGNAVSGVELEPSRDAHATQGVDWIGAGL